MAVSRPGGHKLGRRRWWQPGGLVAKSDTAVLALDALHGARAPGVQERAVAAGASAGRLVRIASRTWLRRCGRSPTKTANAARTYQATLVREGGSSVSGEIAHFEVSQVSAGRRRVRLVGQWTAVRVVGQLK